MVKLSQHEAFSTALVLQWHWKECKQWKERRCKHPLYWVKTWDFD
jgi:hypothetical protein